MDCLDPMGFELEECKMKKYANSLKFVKSLVSNNRVVMFSKTYCPYCKESKKLLDGIGIQYKTIELDQKKKGRIIQKSLHKLTGVWTVPQIFINGQSIGGNSNLQALSLSGQLMGLLEAEGVVPFPVVGKNPPDRK